MNSSGLADMANWVGKEARSTASINFDGSPVTLYPSPVNFSDRAELIVRNENGVEVQRVDIPVTDEPLQWAGVAEGGTPLPSGLYSFEVQSISNNEIIASSLVENYSRVTEVRNQDGGTVLILQGGVAIESDQVTALRDLSF